METQAPRERHHVAKIVERTPIADDLFILRVDPGAAFSFVPGQYATLGIDLDGKRIERAYSLCSSPYEGILEFFVERVPEGQLSPLLHALERDTPLLLRKIAKGRFTIDLRSGRKNHLLLATVTGIAPYVSYIRTLYADWKKGESPMPGEHRFYCIHAASRSWEFGYREELEKTSAEVPWLKYVTTVSRPWEDPSWQGERGRVDDVIRKYTDLWGLNPGETTAYLCGHPNMIEHGRGILLRAGWDKRAIQDEVYFPATSEVGSADKTIQAL